MWRKGNPGRGDSLSRQEVKKIERVARSWCGWRAWVIHGEPWQQEVQEQIGPSWEGQEQ